MVDSDRSDAGAARGGEAFEAWLLASLRSGLVAVDRGGRLRCANDEAHRLLALPGDRGGPAAWLGQPAAEVFAARPALLALLESALQGEAPPSRAELVLEDADGPVRTLGFTVTVIRDPAGAVRGAACSLRDLAPLERLGEQAQLERRLAALGEMAADLAHEIRNPLASVGLSAALLGRRLSGDAEAQRIVAELLDEVRAVERTVTAALDFVKPLARAEVPVELARLLEGALRRVRSRVPFRGEVEWRVPAAPIRVPGDPEQLRSVFENLLANAFEATAGQGGAGRVGLSLARRPVPEAESVLRVHASTPGPPAREEAVVLVSDSGPGVPEAHRERIFQPFFTTRERGSGVGLALAMKLVAAHGGCLDLLDGPGPGATFRVRLPGAGP